MKRMLRMVLFLLAFVAGPSLFAYDVVRRGGFEGTEFAPWYQDRAFGDFRSWRIGTHEPAEGLQDAFCLGRVELRQNLSPVPVNEIREFSFAAQQQFTNMGPAWVEVFYLDGTSTGFIEVPLKGKFVWQTVDILPVLDNTKILSGVSVFGIPANTLSIDNFRIVPLAEKLSIGMLHDKAVLSWFGRKGNSYEVLFSPDLRTWSVAQGFALGLPGVLSYECAVDGGWGFFRLGISEEASGP